LVEPVRDYQRGGLQPEYTQATPLNELADWARPDSAVAREFRQAVHGWLSSGRPGHVGENLLRQLEEWRVAALLAAEAPVEEQRASTLARREMAGRVAAICALGIEALENLISKQPARGTASEALQRLQELSKPNGAAVNVAIAPAVQELFEALAETARSAQTDSGDAK
jgi:hypothetical protein